MKINKSLQHADAITNRKVFRVDDEIEVVVQDVDLKIKSPKKTQLRKSIEEIWLENPEWLGKSSLLVLTGNSANGSSDSLTGKRSLKLDFSPESKSWDWAFAPQDIWSVESKAILNGYHINSPLRKNNTTRVLRSSSPKCVLPLSPVRPIFQVLNAKSFKVNSKMNGVTSESDRMMTPANEIIVPDSECEVISIDVSEPVTTDLVDPPIDNSPEQNNLDVSPRSVEEIAVSPFEPPIIDIDNPSPINESTASLCNGAVPCETVDVPEATPEPPVVLVTPKIERVGPRIIAKPKTSRSELDRLYKSLKEIPWAQSWSPKTFLSRNTRNTFPKRDKGRKLEPEKQIPLKRKPGVLLDVRKTIQKGGTKNLVNSLKPKLKLTDKLKIPAGSFVPKNANLPKIKTEGASSRKRKHAGNDLEGSQPRSSEGGPNQLKLKYSGQEKKRGNISTATTTRSGGPVHKLSTNLAIKQYDASKMCKVKNSPKKKFNILFEDLITCSKTTDGTPPAPRLPTVNIPLVKPLGFYNSTSPTASYPTLPSYAKRAPELKDNNESSKHRIKVSSKTLPYSAAPECNGFYTANSDGHAVSGNVTEGRLGNELLLQKQLVSVLGKEAVDPKKRKLDDESLRYSIRQSECAFRYKEIAVKKHSNYIQIILVPNRSRHNGLTLEALHELREALISAKKDPTCKVLLLNSSGSIFCSGIDLASLVGQVHMPHKMSQAVRSLIETLALFSKPVVAAVNGAAVGLGVTLLAYCDVVFASEKATFFTPYARLGHIPEGAMTLVLPQVVGSLVASDMLLRGRKLTAFQASIYGLVSEVLWPSQFMESVIPRVQAMANQSGQAMESTKVLLRYHQWDKLQSTLENESRLLPKQWLSLPCQRALKEVLSQPEGLVD